MPTVVTTAALMYRGVDHEHASAVSTAMSTLASTDLLFATGSLAVKSWHPALLWSAHQCSTQLIHAGVMSVHGHGHSQ